MFSGLIESKSTVQSILREPGGVRLRVSRPDSFADVKLGDSISISGCCLTVVEFEADWMEFQAGEETLSKTSLGYLADATQKEGQAIGEVNCERALALGDRLGGHLVTGHVDGLGVVSRRDENADWCDMAFDCDFALLRQMAPKGSITVDGVSLTLVLVDQNSFSVALIPHTLQETTLGKLQVGDKVNLETDLLAKYVQRQLENPITSDQ